MVLIVAPSRGSLEADLLVKWVHFLSTTGETRACFSFIHTLANVAL